MTLDTLLETREDFIREAMLRIVGGGERYTFQSLGEDCDLSDAFHAEAKNVARAVRLQAEALADEAGLRLPTASDVAR